MAKSRWWSIVALLLALAFMFYGARPDVTALFWFFTGVIAGGSLMFYLKR